MYCSICLTDVSHNVSAAFIIVARNCLSKYWKIFFKKIIINCQMVNALQLQHLIFSHSMYHHCWKQVLIAKLKLIFISPFSALQSFTILCFSYLSLPKSHHISQLILLELFELIRYSEYLFYFIFLQPVNEVNITGNWISLSPHCKVT